MSEIIEPVPAMPNFQEEEELPIDERRGGGGGEEPGSKKKAGRKKTSNLSDDDKRKRQTEYYEKNKQQRLIYKQCLRGQHKVPNNRCYLHTQYITRYVKEQGSTRPKANLDWINWQGQMRTLTITQPTDELLLLLKNHFSLHFEETSNGTPDLGEKKG